MPMISSFALSEIIIKENLSNSLISNIGGGLRDFFAANDVMRWIN